MSYIDNLTLDSVPGPTPEARELQLKQLRLEQAMYAAQYAAQQAMPGAPWAVYSELPACKAAREAYALSVGQLEELLGPDVHCAQVDHATWSEFWEWSKETSGFRPRQVSITRRAALAAMDAPILSPSAA